MKPVHMFKSTSPGGIHTAQLFPVYGSITFNNQSQKRVKATYRIIVKLHLNKSICISFPPLSDRMSSFIRKVSECGSLFFPTQAVFTT